MPFRQDFEEKEHRKSACKTALKPLRRKVCGLIVNIGHQDNDGRYYSQRMREKSNSLREIYLESVKGSDDCDTLKKSFSSTTVPNLISNMTSHITQPNTHHTTQHHTSHRITHHTPPHITHHQTSPHIIHHHTSYTTTHHTPPHITHHHTSHRITHHTPLHIKHYKPSHTTQTNSPHHDCSLRSVSWDVTVNLPSRVRVQLRVLASLPLIAPINCREHILFSTWSQRWLDIGRLEVNNSNVIFMSLTI